MNPRTTADIASAPAVSASADASADASAQASAETSGADEALELAPGPSRRDFVRHVAFVGGTYAVFSAGCRDKPSTAPPGPPPSPVRKPLTLTHRSFTDDEFATLQAAVDRLLPRDADPGALDANVPEYIDRMLQSSQLPRERQNFAPGLAALDRRAQRMFKMPFAKATPAQQDELLAIFKDSPEDSGEARWYEMLLMLTLEGFLGDPSYGGNKGEVGWRLIGFNLVGRGTLGAPPDGYDGIQQLEGLRCGGKKGC